MCQDVIAQSVIVCHNVIIKYSHLTLFIIILFTFKLSLYKNIKFVKLVLKKNVNIKYSRRKGKNVKHFRIVV